MSFHVRRKDREITDCKELRQILKSAKFITVALCLENEPYLISLSHGYDEDKNCLYFHCAPEGKKLEFIKENNRVWGQALLDFGVTEDCDYAYTSVHFSGRVSLIENLDEKRYAMEVLVRQVSLNPEAKLAKIKSERLEKQTMGRIDIDYFSGKKHQSPNKSNR